MMFYVIGLDHGIVIDIDVIGLNKGVVAYVLCNIS